MSFHGGLTKDGISQPIPIHAFVAALEMYLLNSDAPTASQIEGEFGLDISDPEWVQFKQMYANATDKQQFLRIAKNTMYLAEGGKFNMDDSGAFFANLAAVTSGV